MSLDSMYWSAPPAPSAPRQGHAFEPLNLLSVLSLCSGMMHTLSLKCEIAAIHLIVLVQGDLEARFTVALPARGRTILGSWAAQILVSNLPR